MTDLPPTPDNPPDLFDRTRRRVRRARMAGTAGDYLGQTIGELLAERLDDVAREFADVLLIGARDPALVAGLARRCTRLTLFDASPSIAAAAGGAAAAALSGDEDRLPVEPGQFDLIVWPGGLESVNDVPGALLRCRLALRPDGLLLGAFVGDGSFPSLRAAMQAADAGQDGATAVARMHPQIEVRAMGDLLARAGLTLTVADVDRIALSYRSLNGLVADLRAAALTNVLAGPVHRLDRAAASRAGAAFAAMAGDDGRTAEVVRIVHFSGWAPHPDQPRPARRGSATASLADALKAGAKSVGE